MRNEKKNAWRCCLRIFSLMDLYPNSTFVTSFTQHHVNTFSFKLVLTLFYTIDVEKCWTNEMKWKKNYDGKKTYGLRNDWLTKRRRDQFVPWENNQSLANVSNKFLIELSLYPFLVGVSTFPKDKKSSKEKEICKREKKCLELQILHNIYNVCSHFWLCVLFFNWFYIGNHAQVAHTYKNTRSGVKTLWKLFRGRFYCNFEQFENEWQAMEMHINRKFNAFTTSTAQTLNGSQMKWLFRNIWLCIR